MYSEGRAGQVYVLHFHSIILALDSIVHLVDRLYRKKRSHVVGEACVSPAQRVGLKVSVRLRVRGKSESQEMVLG